jgi:hypothetical protein
LAASHHHLTDRQCRVCTRPSGSCKHGIAGKSHSSFAARFTRLLKATHNAGYDAVKDLQAVALAGFTPNLLYVHPDVKASTLPELLALVRSGKLAYASSGNGTTTHLGAEWLFRGLAKVDVPAVKFALARAQPRDAPGVTNTVSHLRSASRSSICRPLSW